jgi:hypothetical protein
VNHFIRVVLLLVILATGASVAASPSEAASFPAKSYLNTLRHAKGGKGPHQKPISEDYAASQVERYKKAAERDKKKHPQFVGLDLNQKAFWTGELHYLKALDVRISGQDPQHFGYRTLLRWIDHRSHALLAEESKLAHGGPRAFRKSEYDSGGLTALGHNRTKIIAIAKRRGVAVS